MKKMIKLKPFRQTPGFCGPASLKMVLDYYGISVSEKELARMARYSEKKGTSISGLRRAARRFGLYSFAKDNCSLKDLEFYIKKKIPVIVDWFFEDDGHYSVVVNINKKEVVLMDPVLRKVLIFVRRRRFPLDVFFRIWFDFPGDYINKKSSLSLRSMVVIAPFPIKKRK